MIKKRRHHWKYADGDLYHGDCIDVMWHMEPQSVDLVCGSPPYEDARDYGINFDLTGQDWVDWMFCIVTLSLRVSRGLVAFVIGSGKVSGFRWSATPALLCADLHRAGITLRPPKWYMRRALMGSGHDDLNNDIEWIVCATNGGRYPWSDPTALGGPPKYAPGGNPSHRLRDGTRVNLKKLMKREGITQREAARRLGVELYETTITSDTKNGKTTRRLAEYVPPERTNAGNVIHCKHIGGGALGSALAHENEAPFPLKVPDCLIRTFCPPGGVVYDPFGGSGTTIHAAINNGRRWVASDLRRSQIRLMRRRIEEARMKKGFDIRF